MAGHDDMTDTSAFNTQHNAQEMFAMGLFRPESIVRVDPTGPDCTGGTGVEHCKGGEHDWTGC